MAGTFIFIGSIGGGGGGGTGTVVGPGSSTDNALVRYDGTSGTLIKDSGALLDDSNNLALASVTPSNLTASTALVANGSKKVISSVTTLAELAFVSGVTSSVQTQISAKVPLVTATNNAVTRFDGTTGLVQNSGVILDDSNNLSTAGAALLGAVGTPVDGAALELRSTTTAMLLTRLTTAQITALTAVNGMLVYNTSTDRFQGYFAGAWADLHGWGN